MNALRTKAESLGFLDDEAPSAHWLGGDPPDDDETVDADYEDVSPRFDEPSGFGDVGDIGEEEEEEKEEENDWDDFDEDELDEAEGEVEDEEELDEDPDEEPSDPLEVE